jgi:predicted RNA-binding protein YlxR (DUF448 family)
MTDATSQRGDDARLALRFAREGDAVTVYDPHECKVGRVGAWITSDMAIALEDWQ